MCSTWVATVRRLTQSSAAISALLRPSVIPSSTSISRPDSSAVRFGVAGHRALGVSFPAMPLLGIWTKPGAPYLCIEPWQGIADPEGYAGELRDKPWIVEVMPGATRTFAMRIDCDAGTF